MCGFPKILLGFKLREKERLQRASQQLHTLEVIRSPTLLSPKCPGQQRLLSLPSSASSPQSLTPLTTVSWTPSPFPAARHPHFPPSSPTYVFPLLCWSQEEDRKGAHSTRAGLEPRGHLDHHRTAGDQDSWEGSRPGLGDQGATGSRGAVQIARWSLAFLLKVTGSH